jgi:hypothetical protein
MRGDSTEMHIPGARLLWALVLGAASPVFSLGLACAVPLAAFAAIAVLTGNRVEALFLVGAVFLTNQCIGFGLLDYPWTVSTVAWGGVLGLVSVAAVFGAGWIRDQLRDKSPLVTATAMFLGAFALYEGLLFLTTTISGSSSEAYAAPVVARVFFINAAAFAGLLVLRRLAIAIGLTNAATPRLATQGSI